MELELGHRYLDVSLVCFTEWWRMLATGWEEASVLFSVLFT
jgi:hypothetical protein